MEKDTSADNVIVKKLKSLAPLAGVNPIMLEEVYKLMHDVFILRNGTFLSYTSMEEDSLVSIGPIKDCLL
jgi:hypothetical protein